MNELAARAALTQDYRSPAIADRIKAGRRWEDEPYDDTSDGKRIDPADEPRRRVRGRE